jgi:Terminase large subunit, T4likevirus-type, N-terminal
VSSLIAKRLRRLQREMAGLVTRAEAVGPGEPAWAARYRQDLALLLSDSGISPDPWQAAVLRSAAGQILMVCCRQTGKSTVAGALALSTALLEPPALVLILSASERQAGEFFNVHVKGLYDRMGRPVRKTGESALQLHLENGSRVIALPSSEATIRGYSGVNLLVVDEAARVPDSLYYCVRPMLAVSSGRLVCLTTPFGKRGWFFQEWEDCDKARRAGKQPDFETYRIDAGQCPRITPEFLAKEKRSMGERWFRQEYYCSFEDTIDAIFSFEVVQASMDDQLEAWTM